MCSFRSIQKWGFQLILLAGLLCYTDGVSMNTLPTPEVASWVHTTGVEKQQSLTDYLYLDTYDRFLIGFSTYNFRTFLSVSNRICLTAASSQKQKLMHFRLQKEHFISLIQARLDLPEIEA